MSTIGEILREARKKKGVSEEAASKAVKIKVERLRDLEEGCYDAFPAKVYARSFIRQYADYLGVDAAPILQAFEDHNPSGPQRAIFERNEEQGSSAIQRHIPAQAPRLSLTSTGRTVLLASLVIVLLGAVIVRYQMIRSNPSMGQSQPSTEAATNATSPSANATGTDDWQTPVEVNIEAPASLLLSTNNPPAESHRAP